MKNNGNGVKDFIIQNFLYGEDGRLQDDTSFLGNSIIDSTGILELVSFLEETFDIIVSDDEIIPANLDSLKNIDDYIRRKQNRPALETGIPMQYPDGPKNLEPGQQGIIANEPNLLS